MKRILLFTLGLLLFSSSEIPAQNQTGKIRNASFGITETDWSQWQGPEGNGISSESMPDLTKVKVAWQKEIGKGYSGITTAGGRVYTLGHDGKGIETLYCLSLKDGSEIWKESYSGELIARLHTGGPNATPLITGGRIYTMSKDGQVHCRSADTGKLIWQASLPKLLKVKVPSWGFASSPQIVNNQLLFSIGKTVAIDPDNGKLIWTSDTEGRAAYATPRAFTVKGKDYAVVMSAQGAHVISLTDGKTLDLFRLEARSNMIATTPLLFPDSEGEFFVSTSFEGARLSFDGEKLTTVWTNQNMRNKFSNSVLIDGYLYGVDGRHRTARTQIVCLNSKTGEQAWVEKNTGHGTIAAGNDGLCFLSDEGELITFDADPKKFNERARKKVLTDVCWTVPTLSQGRLFVRNDQGKLLCLMP